jgi:signal transduction histidine kinase
MKSDKKAAHTELFTWRSLKTMLMLYFLVIALFIVALVFFNYTSLEKVDFIVDEMLEHHVPFEENLHIMQESVLEEFKHLTEYIHTGEEKELKKFEENHKKFVAAATAAATAATTDDTNGHGHDEVSPVQQFPEQIAKIQETHHEINEISEQLLQAYKDDASMNNTLPHLLSIAHEINELDEVLHELIHNEHEEREVVQEQIYAVQATANRNNVIVGVFVIILSILLGLFVSQRITKPLAQLTQSNKLIIQGKFKEAQQQQQQQQQRNLPTEIKELMETRKKALQELADKKNIEETNRQLRQATKELERKSAFDEKKRLATLSILEDIDEQKKIIEKANKKLYVESLYPKMNPGPSLQLRMNGNVKAANPAALKVFGDIKSSFFNAIGIDAGIVAKMVSQQKLYQTEIQFKNNFYNVTCKKDAQADLIFVYCVDITARRDAENKLRDAYDELQQLDKAKDEFVLLTSHELKSPLFPIMGNVELLMEGAAGPITDEQKAKMDIILRNSLQLKNRIDDFLDLSKLEIHRLKLNKKKHDIMTLVSEEKEDFAQFAHENNATITVHGPRSADVVCDRDRIKQVLANLIKNAITYSKETKNEVAMNVNLSRPNVTIKVTDTGIGISPENQKRLFDKFYRVEQSASRQHQGTGVGLAICMGIIKLHNGTLTVESIPGKGSTFTITLPRNAQRRGETKRL